MALILMVNANDSWCATFSQSGFLVWHDTAIFFRPTFGGPYAPLWRLYLHLLDLQLIARRNPCFGIDQAYRSVNIT